MKITYIVSTFPKLSETFILRQITDLIDRGHDVEIISVHRVNEEKVHEEVTRYGLLSKTIYLSKNSSALGFDITDRLLTSLVFTDIIHSHFAAEPTDFAVRISKLFAIPFVFTSHAYDIFIHPNVSALRDKIMRSSRVITVSEYNRDYLSNLIGEDIRKHIEIIRYGIDLEKFSYRERTAMEEVRFLFVGRFVEKKGIPYLLEAFAAVLKEFPSAKLRLIGDGTEKSVAQERVATLGIGDSVTFLGPGTHSSVVEEMALADVFVSPSVTAANGDREGVPNTLMEAKASGLPVVSTFHSGIPELVRDQVSGFLVPERDVDALAERMLILANNPALRRSMGLAGRKYVEAHHDRRVEVEKLEILFTKLLSGFPLVSEIPRDHRAKLEERLKEIANYLVENRGDQLRKLNELLARQNEAITRNEDRVKRLDDVARLLNDVKQRDDRIITLLTEREQSGKQIAELGGELRGKEAKLRETEAGIQSLTSEVQKLQGVEKTQEARISEFSRELAEQNAIAKGLQAEVEKRGERIKFLEHDLKRKQEELAVLRKWLGDITASLPYKVFKKYVAPLRDWMKKKPEPASQSSSATVAQGGVQLVFLPDWSKANPYQRLLYDELSGQGIPSKGLQGRDFTLMWIWRNRSTVAILHLHWLFGLYDYQQRGISIPKVILFVLKVGLARFCGYRLFWTVHNFISHEATRVWLETIVRRFVALVCEGLIVHCQYARNLVVTHWSIPPDKIHVMPMGSYIGYYKDSSNRELASSRLSIPSHAFVFLFFGMVRKYKGIPELIEAFKQVREKHPDVWLIIAGAPHNEEIRDEITSLSEGGNIHLALQHIPDEEIQHYFHASDVVVLPFVNILSTSSALLALTFNKPCILPRKGCIPELMVPDAGMMYEHQSELAMCMLKMIERSRSTPPSDAPRKLAESLDWKYIIRRSYLPVLTMSKTKRTVMIITNYLPQFDRASGCFRLFNIIKGLVREFNVIVYAEWFHKFYVPDNDPYERALKELGVEVVLPLHGEGQTKAKLRELLLGRNFAAIIIEFFHITNLNIDLIRELRPDVPVITDSVDIRYYRMEMMAEVQKDIEIERQAGETKEQELLAYSKADRVWTVTEFDGNIIRKVLPDIIVDIVPNLHPIPDTVKNRSERTPKSVLFVGGFNHPPNIDAVLYFHNEILPIVYREIPELSVTIVGDSPPESIQQLHREAFRVVGFVPETKPYLDTAYLSIAPLRFGAGMKGKVGEALVSGLPVVTTSIGNQGMSLRHLEEAWIGDSPEEFARGIVTLCQDDELYDNLAMNGRNLMKRNYSVEVVQRKISGVLGSLPKRDGASMAKQDAA